MPMGNNTVYCLDTNFFINLKGYYFFDVFKTLKENLEHLAQTKRIVVHKAVLDEIERKDDEISKWVKATIKVVEDIDENQAKILPDIIIENNIGWTKGEKTPADPFIIALAEVKGYTVVTQEKALQYNKGANNRIPAICKNRGVSCICVADFFKSEGWSF